MEDIIPYDYFFLIEEDKVIPPNLLKEERKNKKIERGDIKPNP